MASLLFVVKLVSMATAGVLGLTGLVHSYKDENGKLTNAGRWAFAGILLSSLLSIVILGLEQHQAIASANESARSLAESARRQEEISAKLERTSQRQLETLETTKKVSVGMEQSLSDQQKLLMGSESLLTKTSSIQEEQSKTLTQQRILFSKQDTVLKNLTGGDSFCYVRPAVNNDNLVLALYSKGEFPLYDIQIDVTDLDERKTVAVFEQPTISTTFAKELGSMSLEGATRKRFQVNIRTRYTIFREELRLIKLDDVWASAYRVEKTAVAIPEKISVLSELPRQPRPQVGDIVKLPSLRGYYELLRLSPGVFSERTFLLIEIDFNFPRNESGYVEW